MSFKYDDGSESHKQHYLPIVEIKEHNVIIDGKNFLDQPRKNDLKTYDNIRQIVTGQGHDYTARCLLDYPYFKQHYKLICKWLSTEWQNNIKNFQ